MPAIKSDITSGWKMLIMSKAVKDVWEAKGGELYKEPVIIIAREGVAKVSHYAVI